MRESGILLHISSLSNEYGIGTLGKCAYQFIDFLEKSNQKLWQVLPIGPTSYGDSPYQTFSAFAGNPYFIDFDLLKEDGLLLENEYNMYKGEVNSSIDYENLYNYRFKVLKLAYNRFDMQNEHFIKFEKENDWIEDYSLFMAIKGTQPEGNWQGWEDKYKYRDDEAIEEFIKENIDEVNFWKFLQFEFFKQWSAVKEYANQRGIKIVGDMPIYVAYDSCDVWSNPSNWLLDENLLPKVVAGCPPDAFTSTGQLWGNPIYDYKKHEKEGFSWWIKRIEDSFKLFDVVRIDHFRGFSGYYTIPALDKTAEHGTWEEGPGIRLFNAIKAKLGNELKIIAEDLGFLTEDVYKLVEETNFPGMKILQFGFGIDYDSDYAMHNLTKHSICYPGTHDNDTIRGWFESLPENEKEYVLDYLDLDDETRISEKLISEGFKSVCDTFIVPAQDYLNLGKEARINTPSTLGGNWVWRINQELLDDKLAQRIKKLVTIYKR